MRKRAGLTLILIGTVLLLAALSLCLYNHWQSVRAGQAAERTLEQLTVLIQRAQQDTGEGEPDPESSATEPSATEPAEQEDTPQEELPEEEDLTTVTLDGYDYMGVLSIPTLGLELPVISQWSYAGLKVAPCRYSGGLSTGKLVICAHNYSTHFGKLKYLTAGDTVTLTTLDGTVNTYRVTELTTLQPTALDQLSGGTWDLTLYTCTIGGKARVVVRCVRVE